MTSAIEVKVFKTVDSIGKDAIDSLTDDPFFTYGWFKTLETSKPIEVNPFYLTAYYDGKLVAFAPCFLDVADHYFRFGPRIPFLKKVLNLRSQLNLGQDHVLLCYSPFCYRTKIFLGNNLNVGLLINDLSREIDAICRKEKILFSSFLFVSEFDKRLLMHLENLGYRKFLFRPSFYLDVRWRSFEDYLGSLETNTRHQVRREIRSCRENGVTIEHVADFKGLSKTMSDLSLNLLSKYNKSTTRIFAPSFYESLSDYAKDRTQVFVAKKKGAVIGFSVCLRYGETLDVFHAGFNYELQKKSDFTYFNVGYYEPIRWAIQEGIRKMYYRIIAEDVKFRRGCKPERLYSFVKCYNRLVDSQISNYSRIRKRIWP